MDIKGKTILVTGSTGFLGSHLINRLTQFKKTRVRALVVPELSCSYQSSGSPVRKVVGDMTSIEDMREATRGCDIVVHCAVGEPDVTVSGTRNVAKAAVENQVKRFIYISSTAVFGYNPKFDEMEEKRLTGNYSDSNYYNAYCHSKIASERIVFGHYDSDNLPIVVLRPSHIYGPYSLWWTIKPIEMLKQNCYTLIDGGLTPCNAVYVNDMVNAIVLATTEDDAVGQCLTISNGQRTSWKEFFSRYARMFSISPSLFNITSEELNYKKVRQNISFIKKSISNPSMFYYFVKEFAGQAILAKCAISPSVKLKMYKKISRAGSALTKNQDLLEKKTNKESIMEKAPEPWLEKTFILPHIFPIKNASKILGYKPHVSLDEGMRMTEEWLAYCRILPYTSSSIRSNPEYPCISIPLQK